MTILLYSEIVQRKLFNVNRIGKLIYILSYSSDFYCYYVYISNILGVSRDETIGENDRWFNEVELIEE